VLQFPPVVIAVLSFRGVLHADLSCALTAAGADWRWTVEDLRGCTGVVLGVFGSEGFDVRIRLAGLHHGCQLPEGLAPALALTVHLSPAKGDGVGLHMTRVTALDETNRDGAGR
jgi:hypothetical protein